MSSRLVSFAAALLACTLPLAASAALSKVSAEVTVDAELTPFGSFTGKSNALSVSDDGKQLKFSVPVKSVKTGIGGRDEDMIARFGGGSAVLTVPRDQVHFAADGKPSKGNVKGKFSLNGAESDVTVHYSAKKEGANQVVDANFKFDYRKHHVDKEGKRGEKACKIGICVAQQLVVKLSGGKFKE